MLAEPIEQEGYRVQLEVFEGPLDLLLFLIKQQEIDIYDIPVARITDQYLQYLDLMQGLNIAIAGEYLVTAATLIYIKSKMLLPQDPAAELEGENADPRRELVEQLLEHERFKKAAALLHDREVVELSVWPRGGGEFEEEERETVSAGVFDLVQAFHAMIERFKDQIIFTVDPEMVTLEQKLVEIRRLLSLQKEFLFSFFFQQRISRLHLMMTFVALLELAKSGELRLSQKQSFEDIRIVAC
ncbi:MAG TPA: segregation/condensation protein A [Acidobacteriota bacterium]|nr:segregation/condensation protein A [Acidobacteriota bacterium]